MEIIEENQPSQEILHQVRLEFIHRAMDRLAREQAIARGEAVPATVAHGGSRVIASNSDKKSRTENHR
jgi:hypothetical protein